MYPCVPAHQRERLGAPDFKGFGYELMGEKINVDEK